MPVLESDGKHVKIIAWKNTHVVPGILEIDVRTEADIDTRETVKGLVRCGASGKAARYEESKQAAEDWRMEVCQPMHSNAQRRNITLGEVEHCTQRVAARKLYAGDE